jgi:hypothetical protein
MVLEEYRPSIKILKEDLTISPPEMEPLKTITSLRKEIANTEDF